MQTADIKFINMNVYTAKVDFTILILSIFII